VSIRNLLAAAAVNYLSTLNVVDVLGDGSCKALYRFESNLLDTSGTYNGTLLAGSVTYPTGKFGTSILSSSARIDTGTKLLMPYNGSYSISVWFKYEADVRFSFANRFNAAITNSYGDTFNTETGKKIQFGKVWHGILTGQESEGDRAWLSIMEYVHNFTVGSFHHLVLSFNRASNIANLYVDGVLVTTKNDFPTANFDSGQNVYLLSRGDQVYNGTMDHLRFFNRAITQSEVTRLYNEL